MHDLNSWLSYIEKSCSSNIKMGLTGIQSAIEILNLQLNKKIIMVAGTNGKGSCINMMESYLSLEGVRFATYTSPHLVDFRERITINKEYIDEELLISAFVEIENKVTPKVKLTYFEFITLAAFYCFSKVDVDVYLLEIGLGGRLDCVNSLDADISVITSVDFDHKDILGSTKEKIQYEKSGIIKENQKVILGKDLFLAYCKAKSFNNIIKMYDKDFSIIEKENTWDLISNKKKITELPKNHLECINIALAFFAVSELLGHELEKEKMIKAIQNANLKGRFQKIKYKEKNLILDVAHNEQAVKNLIKKVNLNEVEVFFAIQKSKEWEKILKLFEKNTQWNFIDMKSDLFTNPRKLQKAVKYSKIIDNYLDVIPTINNKDILIFGSFYLIGDVLKNVIEI